MNFKKTLSASFLMSLFFSGAYSGIFSSKEEKDSLLQRSIKESLEREKNKKKTTLSGFIVTTDEVDKKNKSIDSGSLNRSNRIKMERKNWLDENFGKEVDKSKQEAARSVSEEKSNPNLKEEETPTTSNIVTVDQIRDGLICKLSSIKNKQDNNLELNYEDLKFLLKLSEDAAIILAIRDQIISKKEGLAEIF